jgi:hypothetical protein
VDGSVICVQFSQQKWNVRSMLTWTRSEPLRAVDMFGWVITMQNENGRNVHVFVSDEALKDLASPPRYDLDRLHEYHSTIEAIASAKHTAGAADLRGYIYITSVDIR